MVEKPDFETKAFSNEVWTRMKELRRERYKLSFEAQTKGGLCVTGFAWGYLPLLAGFGNFGNPSPGTDFTRIAREGAGSEGLVKFVNLAESRGLSPVCGAIAAHLGQVYAGTSFGGSSGNKMMPDFVFAPSGCHAQYKGGQICADILGLPMLVIDAPPKNTANSRSYLFSQLADAIEWIEKRTKLEFNDERFIEATRNDIRSRVMWAKICEVMKAVPAPMSYRQAMSLRLPLITYAYSKGTADYMEMLYHEMQERVKNKISGAPFEKKRLAHEGLHPLYRPDLLRWPEEYGAAFNQGEFMMAFGTFRFTADGHRIAGQTLEERGIVLKNREDALCALVEQRYPAEEEGVDYDSQERRLLHFLQMVKDWHIDGIMMHLARRCAALCMGIYTRIGDIRQAGIPLATYEASEGDPKEWNEARVRDDFTRFFESLGLTKISSLDEKDSDADV
jgi:benzoyl-CoA reductase/2-hydroxyglutaryl-CoA dehydratase subunit BcrC/BadD/HgdB